MGDMKNVYKMLHPKREGRRPLGRCRWKDNIKLNLKEIGCVDVDSSVSG
jgi:hypothetical protein